MDAPVPLDLFSPGRGARPPHLAGREEELKEISKKIPKPRGKPPGRDVVLIGPRGNGKTVLLAEFARRCRKAGADVVQRTPDKLRTEEDLAVWLLEADPKRRETQRKTNEEEAESFWPEVLDDLAEFAEKTWSKSAKLRKSAIPGLLSARFKGMRETRRAETLRHLDLLLECAARFRPRAAIIDEAHALNPEIAQSLLNTAQNVNSAGAPFLLVMAGTPQLAKANASFWERCKEIGVGLLSDEATREALEKPLAKYGVSFDPEALDAVVEDSQGYPYFVQMWGEALCQALAEAAGEEAERSIGAETVAAARPGLERQKKTFYNRRYAELFEQGLIPAAERLARAFSTFEQLDLLTAAEIAGKKAREALERLGYLWQPAGASAYEPGIPSLTRHVLAQRERHAETRKTAAAAEENAPSPRARAAAI